ncbi:MAG: prepilin-type N-terminal cleavage/methylation domain-containing protein [Deltaproteobacteria bacterium]|nr:prepilin-type N-terminal cleavage/methylation domain-containing protein [Deltaproteobacteria bacterium]
MRTAVDRRGFTLVETTIVVLIIAITLSMAIPAVTNITHANLRASARKVAGAIRYTYDLAARKNATFRVVFDLEERKYWIESTGDRFLLDPEKTEVSDGALETEERPRFLRRSFVESEEMWKPKSRPSFSRVSTPLSKVAELPEGIGFQTVWVAHQADSVRAGQAYLYCFPTGMTERAVIHLADEDENVYTLWVFPLTGRVRIYPKLVEAPDE